VFISYRRQLSESLALLIRKDLNEHRVDAFVDFENLDSGEFARKILTQIEAREHFIVLLQPGSLDRIGEDGDWLRLEIAHALACGRNVVPVTANGFEFRRDLVLPLDVARLSSFNAVPIQPGYFDAAMERLRTRFLKKSPNPAIPLLAGTRNIAGLARRGRLEVGEDVVEVKATSGGDQDQRIVEWLVKNFKNDYGVDLSRDKMALMRLREAAEKAKTELSRSAESYIHLPYISHSADGPLHLFAKLTRAEFQAL
jgi:hypothetical protein